MRVVYQLGALAVVSLLAAVPVRAESMAAQYKLNLDRDVCTAAEAAASFLVACQQPGEDGVAGWSWVVGQGEPSANVAGLASLGLLDAFDATGNQDYLRAVTRYAEGLLSRRDSFTVKNLPYKSDIELLARLGRLNDDAAMQRAAAGLFALVQARSPSGADEVARIAAGRKAAPALLGFDVALAVRAAQAVGEDRYALQLADAVLGRRASWWLEKRDPRFSIVSAGALVAALDRLNPSHYARAIGNLRARLAALQADSGAWASNETQPTAYAVLALMGSKLAEERAAARRGALWLKSTMLKQGSFASYNDYMPEPFVGRVISEVNAEALSALSALCMNR